MQGALSRQGRPSPPDTRSAVPAAVAIQPKRPCILVVDDNADVLRVISRTLELAGYTVTHAADGFAGLAILETDCPDLLITDNRMPGMTGDALIVEARARFPDLRILRLSGGGDEEHAGVTTLYKPFQPDELIEVVRELVAA